MVRRIVADTRRLRFSPRDTGGPRTRQLVLSDPPAHSFRGRAHSAYGHAFLLSLGPGTGFSESVFFQPLLRHQICSIHDYAILTL